MRQPPAYVRRLRAVADPDASDPESSHAAAAIFNQRLEDEAALHRLLTEAERRVDQRYSVTLSHGMGGADFFAALRGKADIMNSAVVADTLRLEMMGRSMTSEEIAHSLCTHRPMTFHMERLRACTPPLAPLVVMADRASTARSESCLRMLDVLVQMDGVVPLRDLRRLASSCYTARALVSATLRSPQLSVGKADASWENAAFVARLPGLLRLRVRGDLLLPLIDLAAVRSKPRMRLKSADGSLAISAATTHSASPTT